jgi:DNA-binding CsgD family transcriptional regulator
MTGIALHRMHEELAYAWTRPDYVPRLEAIIAGGIPGALVGLMGWRGTLATTPDAPGNVRHALNTPWFASGQVLAQRGYDPRCHRSTDPLANRVMDARAVSRVMGRTAYRVFREDALAPLGIGPFGRVALYDQERFLMLCVFGRARNDGDFTTEELDMVQKLVPTVTAGLAARRALDKESLAPGNVADIANAIDGPAMIVAPGGVVVFANAMARATYPKHPPWLSVCSCDEEDITRPAWVKRVPLMFGHRRLYLLMPTATDIDPERAHQAPWAKRWRLAPRQAKVAASIARGLSDKEIAVELGLTLSTTRTYVKRLFARVGVHSRTELVRGIFR